MWRNTRMAALACLLACCASLTGTRANAAGFVDTLAARCKGEAAFALGACACVAHNRLAQGQSESAVLAAFYAAPITPTDAEVRRVGAVLDGVTLCDERLWFMWSREDVARLGLDEGDALIVIERTPLAVLFYARDALNV